MTSEAVVGHCRFHPLPFGESSPNFQDILVAWSSWCPTLFLVKKFLGSKVTAQKGVKRLKSISSYSFWARMFIFSGCVVLPKAENCTDQIFDLGPQNFTKNFWHHCRLMQNCPKYRGSRLSQIVYSKLGRYQCSTEAPGNQKQTRSPSKHSKISLSRYQTGGLYCTRPSTSAYLPHRNPTAGNVPAL